MWDIEVDVACVGAGPATLASAVAATDAGASVLLATPAADRGLPRTSVAVRPRVAGFLDSWNRRDRDTQTSRYLAEFADGCASPGVFPGDTRLTVRSVTAVPRPTGAEAFIGARLSVWNATCLASPYGVFFSTVSGWHTQRMRTEEGQTLEVMPVSSLVSSDLADDFDATAWLQGQVSARAMDHHRFSDLDRIVFDNGRIVGVELATADGPLSVGVRRALSLTSGQASAALPAVPAVDAEDLRVCIVGQPASRFLRVELLGTTSSSRPMCAASGHQLRYAMHETRSLHSGAGRCGKLR